MEISASSLMQEMQAQGGSRCHAADPARSSGQSDFGQMLQQALATSTSCRAPPTICVPVSTWATSRLDLSQVMIAGQKSSIAFEATVQVRNKMVDAYKTIMNMPV
jgi:flagellar hook-basal body complex protein FliE